MTIERRADLVLPAILDDLVGASDLAYVDDVLRTTARTRQGRVAASIQRWLPILDAAGASTTGARVPWRGFALAVVIIVLSAAGLALVVGSLNRQRLPPPFGLAAPGLVAFEEGGDIVATLPDGTGRRTLVTGPGVHWGLVWSHRGDLFAYWSTTSKTADLQAAPASLWVSSWDGSNRHVVSGRPVFDVADLLPAVSWSPDDRQLAFASQGVLSVVNADGSGLHPLGDNSLRRTGPVWSPDGSLIAYTAQSLTDPFFTLSLRVIDPDGTGDREVIAAHGSHEIGANSNPSWSPDSRSILTHVSVGTGLPDIWIAQRDAAGLWSPARPVVPGPEADFLPAWSTAGTRFTFLRAVEGSEDLLVMLADADGSTVTRLSDRHVTLTTPCWSPDDRFIRAEGAGPDRTILLIPLDRSPAIEIHALDGVSAGCNLQRLAP
jgi:Tol biopolymer transport system component